MGKPQLTQLIMTSEGKYFTKTSTPFSKKLGLHFLHPTALFTQNKVIIFKTRRMSEAYILCQLIYFQYKNI